ncbi:unnamed protein product [Bursaphelenchus xylophilus]|uniref:(pine wood nematode) hypothetical protein n=1 Tax=Bursaphelenchus xylophilus TaxID=6326 RepID=A0A1I7RV67_BURXY|nr:unnamed protein product [Bursaphelenchus xylophilus]CAG9124662.1 unnamed protein product [Bursaphelenchus xylophilus]
MTARSEEWLNRRLELKNSLEEVQSMALSQTEIERIIDNLSTTTAQLIDQEPQTALTQDTQWSYYSDNSSVSVESSDQSWSQSSEGYVQGHSETKTISSGTKVTSDSVETSLKKEISNLEYDTENDAKVSQYQLEEMREYGPMHDAYKWKLLSLQPRHEAVYDDIESVYLF